MVQRVSKSKIRVVPRDGELEVTVNINISLDGQLTALSSGDADVEAVKEEEDKVATFIPDFLSGSKLKFGKKE